MSDETKPEPEVRDGDRIAKVMARAGLCSRREAEAWIAEGRVAVNGAVLASPAYNVTPDDDVRVDGQRLSAPERTRLFLFHKPRGLVTTSKDPEGRQTIFDALPPDLPRVVAIGRLDINTEGLLLLTNDGGLARVLELPSTGWLRRYRVRAHGAVDQAQLDALRDGVTVEGVDYAGIEAKLDREQGSNAWITMGLREGKNREIKRVLEHMGLSVNRLIRVSFGPFELGDLAEGEVAEVRTRVLRDQLGAKLAREAGADFDAPIAVPAPPPPEPAREERPRRRPEGAKGVRRTFDRDRGRESDREDAPRRQPPAPSTPERKRKHVSALRAEIAKDATDPGPRKRIDRGATQDRKGRTIAVERISKAGASAGETPARARKAGPGRPRSADRGGAGDRSDRPRRSAFEGGAPRREGGGEDRPRRAWTDRAPAGDRPARDGDRTRSARPPRADGEARASRPSRGEGERSFAPRAPRGEARSDGERSRSPRPPRREGERSFAPRPPRGDARGEGERSRTPRAPGGEGERRFAPRPPRGEARGDGERSRSPRPPRGEARSDGERSFAPRPPRAEGSGEGERTRSVRARPEGGPARGGKPFRDDARPRGERSSGGSKPGGKGEGRPRTPGKPGGARPGGAKPGGRPPRSGASGGPKGAGPRRPPGKR